MNIIEFAAKLDTLTVNDVVRAYSGKPGCMCGCRGIYRVNPTNRSLVPDAIDEEVNAAQVRKVFGIVIANAEFDERLFESGILHCDVGARTYALYLKAYYAKPFCVHCHAVVRGADACDECGGPLVRLTDDEILLCCGEPTADAEPLPADLGRANNFATTHKASDIIEAKKNFPGSFDTK